MEACEVIAGRVPYLWHKSRRAFRDGTFTSKFKRAVFLSAVVPLEVGLSYSRLSAAERSLEVREGFQDHRRLPQHRRPNPEHLKRIVAAYKKTTVDAAISANEFRVRGLWKEWLDLNFRTLTAALVNECHDALASLLENYSREEFSRGVAGFDHFDRYRRHPAWGSLYVKSVWAHYVQHLREAGIDPANLSAPMVGNPAGPRVNGDIVRIDTLRHVFHATEIASLLNSIPAPRIVEIGGGDGSQAFQVMRLLGPGARYQLFDLPEVTVLSSFFLLSVCPDTNVRLYGEPPCEDAVIEVLPHFAVTELQRDSVDLAFNSCSFSEMDGASAQAYLRVIEQTCRRYFMHINHDVRLTYRNDDGSTSVNAIGSELIPDPARFRRTYKRPRRFNLPEDRAFPSFEYLYERIAS
jgi:putative sugar O-methyltransferase